MQRALEANLGGKVSAYVVWEPIRYWDREGAARRNQGLVPDPRASHFWSPDLGLARRMQGTIGLTTEPAWDIYLVYAADATWPGDSIPVPADFMHQLSGRLPDSKLLDAPRLARLVSGLITRRAPHEAASSGMVPVSRVAP